MYRGSSFLLWKDYRIHKNVVRHLLRHRHLQSTDFSKITEDQIDEIFALMVWIKNWYENNIHSINGAKRRAHVTDTLTTKIVFGTLGCVPAFDRYFINGLRERGLKYSGLKKENFISVVHFYQKNQPSFLQARKKIQDRTGFRYPPMKLVDMYFWEIGYELDKN